MNPPLFQGSYSKLDLPDIFKGLQSSPDFKEYSKSHESLAFNSKKKIYEEFDRYDKLYYGNQNSLDHSIGRVAKNNEVGIFIFKILNPSHAFSVAKATLQPPVSVRPLK